VFNWFSNFRSARNVYKLPNETSCNIHTLGCEIGKSIFGTEYLVCFYESIEVAAPKVVAPKSYSQVMFAHRIK